MRGITMAMILTGFVSIMVLGFNAEAISTTLVTPNLEECPTNQYLKGFDLLGNLNCEVLPVSQSGNVILEQCPTGEYLKGFNADGSLMCELVPTQTSSSGTVSSFNTEQEAKLQLFADKLTIDETRYYVDSRFSGVGEELRPSGSQFQIYCDKIGTQEGVNPQNCTLYQVSSDGRTSAHIFAKDIDGVWVKVGAMTEATNHEDIQFIMYGDNGVKADGQPYVVLTLKEAGAYIQKGYEPGMCRLSPQPDGTVNCVR